MPPPYRDVVRNEPIEISVAIDGTSVKCGFTYRGDPFGLATDVSGKSELAAITEIDQLVEAVALMAYRELHGQPVFREEDEAVVGRVDARRAWEDMTRVPENGWISNFAGESWRDESVPAEEPDPVAASLGDADLSSLRLTQEDMAALTRGEIPEPLIERLLKARSTENLLDSVLAAVEEMDNRDPTGLGDRALRELREVCGRFKHGSG